MKKKLSGLHDNDNISPFVRTVKKKTSLNAQESLGMNVYRDSRENETTVELKSTLVETSLDDIFVGRESEIKQIHEAFEKHGVVFLQGAGGIGKSELAKQYYYRYKDEGGSDSQRLYSTVVFARYEGNLANIISNDDVFKVVGLSRKIINKNGIDEYQSDEDYARTKLKLLKRIADQRTIIIIDNFDTTVENEPLFKDFVDGANYHVLVTTRKNQPGYKVIAISELDAMSLKQVFFDYLGESSDSVDASCFPNLLEWTGKNTLVIELTAKYMKRRRIRIQTIGELLRNLKELRTHFFEGDSYDKILDILRISELGDDELLFLRSLALLPEAGINYTEYFYAWISRSGDEEYYWDDVLERLSGSGIVKENRKSGVIYLHPVMREVVIKELTPSYENCRPFIDKCAMVGEDADQRMYNFSYETKAVYIACFDSLRQCLLGVTDENYPVYMNISIMYVFGCNLEKAIGFLEEIHGYIRDRFGENSAESMLIYRRKGWKYSNYNMYEKAEQCYKLAADWFWKNRCYSQPESFHAIGNIASLYVDQYLNSFPRDLEMRQKAEEYLAKAYAYGEGIIDATQNQYYHAKVKYHYDCLSRINLKLSLDDGKIDDAKEYLKRLEKAVKEFERFANTHSDECTCISQRASILFAERKTDKALAEFAHAAESYKQYFGSRYPRYFLSLNRCVECALKLSDYKRAYEDVKTMLHLMSETYTEDHPDLVRAEALKKEIEELLLRCEKG